jgi:hypothetical protein
VKRRKPAKWDTNPGIELRAITAVEEGTVVGTIAICTRGRISAQTAMSWLMTDYGFLGQGEVVRRLFIEGNVLTQQRSECVQRMEGDWLLFIDDDMVFPPGAIRELVETQRRFDDTVDMLGGLCFQRGTPYQPTMYVRDPTNGRYQFRETWQDGAAVEVDASGMAFMLIHRRVFDMILFARTGEHLPTFEERALMPPPPFFRWEGTFGEDFLFCQEAKAAGARIFVDTSVEIGHLGEHVITREQFLRELAFRTPAELDAVRDRYTRLGIEPMESREAWTRLEALNARQNGVPPVRPTDDLQGGGLPRVPPRAPH